MERSEVVRGAAGFIGSVSHVRARPQVLATEYHVHVEVKWGRAQRVQGFACSRDAARRSSSAVTTRATIQSTGILEAGDRDLPFLGIPPVASVVDPESSDERALQSGG